MKLTPEIFFKQLNRFFLNRNTETLLLGMLKKCLPHFSSSIQKLWFTQATVGLLRHIFCVVHKDCPFDFTEPYFCFFMKFPVLFSSQATHEIFWLFYVTQKQRQNCHALTSSWYQNIFTCGGGVHASRRNHAWHRLTSETHTNPNGFTFFHPPSSGRWVPVVGPIEQCEHLHNTMSWHWSLLLMA